MYESDKKVYHLFYFGGAIFPQMTVAFLPTPFIKSPNRAKIITI
jgi:hypothetical protein